jgi:hypothetical protein
MGAGMTEGLTAWVCPQTKGHHNVRLRGACNAVVVVFLEFDDSGLI